MKTQHQWSTLITAALFVTAGVLLLIFTEEQMLGGLLITAAVGIPAVRPARVVDVNGNGVADGQTVPPPPLPGSEQ